MSNLPHNSNNPNPNIPQYSDSSDTIAMILEIVFGFFGILGMGWLYAGNIPIALIAFIGFIIVAFIEMTLVTATFGFAACFVFPFNLAVAVISGLKARDYIRNTRTRGSILYVILGIILGVGIICLGMMVFFGGLTALGVLLDQYQ